MFIADAHCDTISRILDTNEGLFQNSGHLDIMRMRKSGVMMQLFAVWTDPKTVNPFARATAVIDKFNKECGINAQYVSVNGVEEGKISAVLTIEGGCVLEGEIANLHKFWDMGVRLMTLTWNGRNALASGVLQDGEVDGGLSGFGREVVREMVKLGMFIDVSHIAERGFWDVIEQTGGAVPIFATHSNARSITNHPRNLTDEQIKAIISTGGFIGLNLFPDFLGGCNVSNIARHAEHIMNLGGVETLGLGADFDGVDVLPDGIHGVEDMGCINEVILGEFGEETARKILFDNLFKRFF
ncbi:MAG: dipeptidase [Clostridiales bacterium]|jgi:membrane dipeptidase|nr:dipeptidase [Clostridiales bacterium]